MHSFFSWAAASPERVVLTMADSGERYTAGQVARQAKRMAQWLIGQGLQPAERFAVVLENRAEILQLVLAARQAGVYAAVLSTHLTPAEVAYVIGDSGARLVVASAGTLAQLDEARQAQSLSCWTVDEAEPCADSLLDALQQLAGERALDLSDRPIGRDLLYSSGTTGQPKGVLQPLLPASQRGQPDPGLERTARHMQMDEHTVYLSPAPLYHAAPLRYTLRALDLGGHAIVMPRFDAAEALALIERYRVTHSQWVPTMFSRLLALPEAVRQQHDLSSHRVAIHAAAPCPVPLKQAMLDWWGDILVEYYAGSEGCGVTQITAQEWRQRPGSVGRAVLGQLHIVGDDGQELPPGEIGQVYFSGGGQFSYLNDEEKTRQAIDERGWASYGDIGHVDEAGYLYLSDRRADLILSGGVNLYPQEIENALAQHPDVAEVAVVGVPHADLGQVPLAAVVPRPGVADTVATALAIATDTAQRLARFKLPQRMVFVDRLPRLPTGKLLRRELRQRFLDEPDPGFALRELAADASPATKGSAA